MMGAGRGERLFAVWFREFGFQNSCAGEKPAKPGAKTTRKRGEKRPNRAGFEFVKLLYSKD